MKCSVCGLCNKGKGFETSRHREVPHIPLMSFRRAYMLICKHKGNKNKGCINPYKPTEKESKETYQYDPFSKIRL